MENLELKAKCENIETAMRHADSLGAKRHWTRHQIDTYFVVERGKLKLRQVKNEPAELIAYERPADRNANVSNYFIYSTFDGTHLNQVLTHALVKDVAVNKERTLYTWKNVRIHFDHVQHLGDFIEFEAVLENKNDLDKSRERLRFLQSFFKIKTEQLIDVGYFDLLKDELK